ncbi:hypothetical protein CNR27_05565 [Luteimonas chenhongjianii]|uniref:VWFA domain-containing protein n=1 Tax=Luteimonas chenhongjianii TaxID=2006110 RepID=A0A290XDG2_9GAMM|nr:VWA domain-containing protein [Luteimonas chenhongjianii]ATD66976.1 hypothetical protein CNR27_05565 [Luteimonas chenhongjianii]
MTPSIEHLQFVRPEWLWALAVLPAIAWAWWRRQRDADAWREAVDPHLLAHLLDGGAQRRGLLGLGAWLLGGVLAVVALAGPGWRQDAVPLHEQGMAPLVVALDLSTATTAGDLPPSRLLQARAKLARLLAGRDAGQVALVAYADDAYTVAPLTEDAANVALYLDALSPDIMPADGSRADRAIAHAARLLRQGQAQRGEILLMTGDVDAAAIAEAAIAARMGYRVSVLGLGTIEGAAHRDGTGALVHARLEPGTLQALAAAGGGGYHALSADDDDLQALGVLTPSGDLAVASARTDASIRRVRDEGYWLILPLLGLVLFAFRRGSALACVLAFALVPALLPLPARAQPPAATAWQRADQVAYARMRDGAAAYQRQDFDEALRKWTGLPGADAAYNRGNALARLGRFEEAIAAYDEALAAQPGMADAVANRAAVEAARKRTPPPGPGQDPRAPPQDGQGQGQPQSGDPGDQDDPSDSTPADPQEPSDTAGSAPPGTSPTPSAPPPDAQAQREAEAAQQERMQRALDGQAEAESADGPPVDATVDDVQREREQANAAWLRRVPDDPGGLLRAKFRLEHERRARGDDR